MDTSSRNREVDSVLWFSGEFNIELGIAIYLKEGCASCRKGEANYQYMFHITAA